MTTETAGGPTLTINYSVSVTEYFCIVAAINKKRRDNSLGEIADTVALSGFWPGCLAAAVRGLWHTDLWFVVFFVAFILSFVLRSVSANKAYRKLLLSLPDVIDTEQTLTISPAGVACSSERCSSQYRWDYFSGVDVVADILAFRFGNGPGIIVPRRAFSHPTDADQFVEAARSFWRGEANQPSDRSVWPPRPGLAVGPRRRSSDH